MTGRWLNGCITVCGLIGAGIGGMAVLGYGLEIPGFYRWVPWDIGMSFPSAIAITFLGLGVFLSSMKDSPEDTGIAIIKASADAAAHLLLETAKNAAKNLKGAP